MNKEINMYTTQLIVSDIVAIAMITLTSPIAISDVPTRSTGALVTKESFFSLATNLNNKNNV